MIGAVWIAISRSRISRGGHNCLTLKIRLLRPSLNRVDEGLAESRLAEAVTGANDRGVFIVHCLLQGIPHTVRAVAGAGVFTNQASVHKNNAGILGYSTGPFEVKIGFALVPRTMR